MILLKFNILRLIFKEKLKDEDDLRKAQTEFDRQLELTKLLLEELHVTHVTINKTKTKC